VFDDVTRNFFRQRKWKSHNFYRAWANSVDISRKATGAFVAHGASFFIIPGNKNDAGETVVPAWMPLQPALDTENAASIASRIKFQFNLTSRL
jgi:hypothetical protein